MNNQPPKPQSELKKFVSFGEEPLPLGLPTNMTDIRKIQLVNKYKDIPDLSFEENQKRREQLAALEESILNRKEYGKSLAQKAKDKKRAKVVAQSKKRNRK